MATNRPVRYELHIRPLIRLLDRDNMAWKLDLWDYDQVRALADTILVRIQADMPPAAYGGPWPREWVDLFTRWKAEGFGRLEVGTGDPTGFKATQSGPDVTLSAQGRVPSAGYRAWLDPQAFEQVGRTYTLYWEPPPTAEPPAPTPFRTRAKFRPPPGTTTVTVVDAAGSRDVPIQVTPALAVPGSVDSVHPVLVGLGATLVERSAAVGGERSVYRFGEETVDVFSGHRQVDVEGPEDVLARIRAATR